MASDDEFECTQVLPLDKSEDTSTLEKLQVAILTLNGKEYPIFNGDSKIGRDPKQCSVVVERKSVSTHHALIEVESGHHIISDLGSSNSTRLNGMLLKPHVRYNLADGAVVQIADLQGSYYILPVKKNQVDTSVQDIFESPSNSHHETPKQVGLNVSEDISFIEDTPIRKDFKQPFPKGRFPSLNETAHHQTTICATPNYSIYEANTQVGTSFENEILNSSVILSETIDDSVAVSEKADSSFIVPCTQEQLSESSLLLHYDTEKSMDASTSESKEDAGSVESAKQQEESAAGEADLFQEAEKQTLSDPHSSITHQPENDDLDCEDLVKHVETIERSLSSETLEVRGQESKGLSETADDGLQNSSTEPGYSKHKPDSSGSSKESSTLEASSEKPQSDDDIHDAKTQLPTLGGCPNPREDGVHMNTADVNNVHDAKTQIVSNNSDSEADDEGVYGACTERPADLGAVDNTEESPSEVKASEDIHNAKTQMVHADDSDTDEEGVYGASTERPHDVASDNASASRWKGSEDIHDIKTQMVHANDSDSDTDEEGVYGACTEKPPHVAVINASEESVAEIKGSEDIHDAKTQMVHANDSDSDTDEEGVYGACTEKPRTLALVNASEESVAESKGLEDIHEAKTQMVHANDSDSDTDEEGVYGACTEKPCTMAVVNASEESVAEIKGSEDIHDAKTQMVFAKDSDSESNEEGVGNADRKRSENFHDAKTQVAFTKDSGSETDNGDVYGACTEKPKNIENIHDVKTQLLTLGRPGTADGDVYGACTEKPQEIDNIHGVKTQPLSPNNGSGLVGSSKSESMNTNVEENIHDAKTQMITNNSDSETDEEGMYGACTEKPSNFAVDNASRVNVAINQGSEDIHNAKTQMVHADDSDTDEEGVYKACTEKPVHFALANASARSASSKKGSEDIHDAKTQMITNNSDSETDEEGMYAACTEKPSNFAVDNASKVNVAINQGSEDIHNAKTQMVHAVDSDSDEEGVYGACTEKFAFANTRSKSASTVEGSEDVHDAKTQIVLENDLGSETDDGACTKKLDTIGNLHDAKTQVLTLGKSSDPVDISKPDSVDMNEEEGIHDAKTQMICDNSDSETDEEGAYGASMEGPHASSKKTQLMSNSTEVTNIHSANTLVLGLIQMDTEKGVTDIGQTSTLYDAETQILPEVISKSDKCKNDVSENVPLGNVPKQPVNAKGSPRKRLSLSYRKKIGGTKEDTIRLMETKTVKETSCNDDVFTAATQILPGPSETNPEDDIFSAATQRLETPRPCRRLKGQTINESVDASSIDTAQVTPNTGRVETSTPKNVNARSNPKVCTSQIPLSPSPKVGDDDKCSQEDIFSAATQVLPSPASSRRTRGQNISPENVSISKPTDIFSSPLSARKSPSEKINPSPENDLFSAATQVLPRPKPSRGTRSQNLSQEIHSRTESTDKLPTPYPKISSPEKNLVLSAATQVLPSPVPSRKTRGQNLSQEGTSICEPSKVLPSPASSKKSPVLNLSEENYTHSTVTQALPSAVVYSKRTRGQNSSQENDCISDLKNVLSNPISPRKSPRKSSSLSQEKSSSQDPPCPGLNKGIKGENSSEEKMISETASPKASHLTPSMKGSRDNLPNTVPDQLLPNQCSNMSGMETELSVHAHVAHMSNKTVKLDVMTSKPTSSRRSVSFADSIHYLSSPKSTTVAGIEKLPKPPVQTRSRKSTKKQGKTERQGCKRKQHLGSSVSDGYIEESSSDSNKSLECTIDEGSPPHTKSDKEDVISDPEEDQPLQAETIAASKSHFEHLKRHTVTPAGSGSTSPVVSRSSGRRMLSLSRSKLSSQGLLKSPEGQSVKAPSPQKEEKVVLELQQPSENDGVVTGKGTESNSSTVGVTLKNKPSCDKNNFVALPPVLHHEASKSSTDGNTSEKASASPRKSMRSKESLEEDCANALGVEGTSKSSRVSSRGKSARNTATQSSSQNPDNENCESTVPSVGEAATGLTSASVSQQVTLQRNPEESKSKPAVKESRKSKQNVLSQNIDQSRSTRRTRGQLSISSSSNSSEVSELSITSKVSVKTRSTRTKNESSKPRRKIATQSSESDSCASDPKDTKCNPPNVADVQSGQSKSISSSKKETTENETKSAFSSHTTLIVREKNAPLKKTTAVEDEVIQSASTETSLEGLVPDVVGRRPTRSRRQPAKAARACSPLNTELNTKQKPDSRKTSEFSDDIHLNEAHAEGGSQMKITKTNVKVKEAKTLTTLNEVTSTKATVSEESDTPLSRGQRSSRAKKLPEKLKGEKINLKEAVTIPEENVSASENPSQSSITSVAGDRRSSRLRKQTVTLRDYDCSGESESQESEEVSSKDEVGASSSGVPARGRKSNRNTKQKPSTSAKGVKRLSADMAGEEIVPPKLTREKSALSLILETSTHSTNALDESAGPSSLKRGNALNDSVCSEAGPESKRRRGRLDSTASINSSPRRSVRQSQSFKETTSVNVLFSFYNNPLLENIVKQLGGSIVDTVEAAGVLVTDKLRRTVKLLSIVGKGLPVVGPTWLINSKSAGQLLDPWEHLLTDQEGETKFNMKLEASLKKAASYPILQNYNILVTKSVKPEPEEMKAIIQSCGGHCLSRPPRVWPDNSAVISCDEDKNIWTKFKGKVPVVSSEWLLSGVLRQELQNDKFTL